MICMTRCLSSCRKHFISCKIHCWFFSLNRFDPSTPYKRAQTTLTSTVSVPIHNVSSANVRRSYAPISNTSSNVLYNSATRKPRSYISSAATLMKTWVKTSVGNAELTKQMMLFIPSAVKNDARMNEHFPSFCHWLLWFSWNKMFCF